MKFSILIMGTLGPKMTMIKQRSKKRKRKKMKDEDGIKDNAIIVN